MDTTGHLYDDFIRVLFLDTHREVSTFTNEFPEESDQFHFLRVSCFTNLKRVVGLIMAKSSTIQISIPLDLSSRSFIHVPRFIRSTENKHTLSLNSVKWSFPESIWSHFFRESKFHEVLEFFGEVKWSLVKSNTVQCTHVRWSGLHKNFIEFYTKSMVVNCQNFRPPHLFPLPYRPQDKELYQAFLGVLIDLIMMHDWVLGLDYQNIW